MCTSNMTHFLRSSLQFGLWIDPLHYFASCQLQNVFYALLLFDILFNITSNATLNIFLFIFHSLALIFKTPRVEGDSFVD